MKNKKIFTYSLLLLIFLCSLQGYSQYTNPANYVLPSLIGTQTQYTARDYIKLTPGFTFTATGSTTATTLNAKIDELSIPLVNPNPTSPILANDPALEIDTLLPVAAIPGKAGVSGSGAATYEIPIGMPPGTKGMVPNLSIVYNSQAGNGIMGLGWNISGLSAITRIPQTFYKNGNTTAVDFSANDRFALDGNRLVLVAGSSYGADGAEYHTESENFSKIISYGTSGTGPSYFKVYTTDGSVIEYGNVNPNNTVADSRFIPSISTGPIQTVYSWHINKITDRFGNYILFKYRTVNNELIIDQIEYTGTVNFTPYNKVKFYYEEKTDKSFYYVGGVKLQQNLLLSKIKVFAETQIRDEYTFDYYYDNTLAATKLKKVNQKVNNQTDINATKVLWYDNNVADFNLSTEVSGGLTFSCTNCDQRKFAVGDFDGDGKDEYLVFEGHIADNPSLGWYGKYWKIYKYTGFNNLELVASGIWPPSTQGIVVTDIQPSDMDKDGIDEFYIRMVASQGDGSYRNIYTLYKYDKDNHVIVHVSNNYDISDINSSATSYAFRKQKEIVDYNDDGMIDVILIEEGNGLTSFHFYANTGNGLQKSTYVHQLPYNVDDIELIDFNGNGKIDILIVKDFNTTIHEFNGSSFTQLYNSGFPTKVHKFYTGDFNGDKKTDILFVDNNTWKIAYATGQNNEFSWPNTLTDIPYSQYDLQIVVSDFNGDGRDDVLKTYRNDLNNTEFISYYFSQTNHFEIKNYSNPMTGNNLNSYNFYIGDFNGDGKRDLGGLSLRYSLIYQSPAILFFQQDTKSNFVKSVYNGFHNYNTFSYKSLTEGDPFYIKGSSSTSSIINIQVPFYTVSTLSFTDNFNNTINDNYTYSGLMFHKTANQLLGFSSITKINSVLGTKTTDNYSELGVFNNLILTKSESFVYPTIPPSPGGYMNWQTKDVVTYDYNVKDFPSSTSSLDSRRCFIYTHKTTKKDFLNNIKQESGYLDPLNQFPSLGNNSIFDKIVEKTYSNITDILPYSETVKIITYKSPPSYANWYASQVSSETITSKINNSTEPDYIRTKNNYYTYENISKIVSDELNPDFNVSEEFTYNVFGEVVSTTINPPTNNSNPATAVVAFTDSKEYDDKGRFVTKEINDLNHITQYFYEPKFGNVIKTIDPNLFETNFEYDAIGRKKKTIFHDNTFESISNTWALGGSNPTNSLYKVVSSSSGNPDITTYYDALGRDILSKSINLNGAEVFVQKNYNAKGQLTSASLPYFTTGTPLFTTYTYDNYSRKTQELQPLPDGTITNIAYNGRTTTVSSGKNTNFQLKTSYSNCLGQIDSITDNSNQTIKYIYNNQGLVKQTNVSGMTQAVITSYNLHGKRISLLDPDAGLSTTIYDAYDQVREQRDAKQNALAVPVGTKMQYDKLGRITSRTHKNGATDCITTYEYDNPNNLPNKLKGSLSKVTAWNGTIDEYFYDALGRDWKTVESIDGVSYTESMGYDNMGRLETYTYPDNYIIKYEYQNGQLAKVKINSNATIWEALQQDIMGNITKYKSGSSEETNKFFDPSNGRLTGISTGVGSNSSIQNLAYDYDVFGNLGMRSDAITQQVEYFTYDNLNRLNERTIFHNGPQVDYSAMQYDNTGNITIMPGIGNFIYSGVNAGPHAITKIENNIGNINTTQNIDYTAFNKVEEIREPNSVGIQQKLTFTYGADYSRRKTQYYNNGNLVSTKYFLMGNYEVKVNPATGLSVKDHYISGGDGLAAIYRVNEAGVGTMYYVHKDHLGSFDVITDGNGNIIERYSFDAWGNRRNPNEWKDADSRTTWLFERGFTGHEHLDKFGLINMNGRLYDPKLGRFLSPDPYVQEPDNTQNFNRYSYCWNNPLVYTDPSGEFVWLMPAFFGGVLNLTMNGGNIHNGWDALGFFGIGALAGGLSAGIGAGIATSYAGASFGAGFVGSTQGVSTILGASFNSSFFSGLAIGAASGFSSGFVGGAGNAWMTGKSFTEGLDAGFTAGGWGALTSGVFGGISGGLDAVANGRGFWNGNVPYKDVSLNIPYVPQDGSMDCKFAASEGIEKYYGGNRTQSDFKAIANNLSEKATYPEYLEAIGHKNMGIPTKPIHIATTMEVNKMPTQVITKEGKNLLHVGNVTRIRIWNNTVNSRFNLWVNDPIRGIVKYSGRNLEKIMYFDHTIGGIN